MTTTRQRLEQRAKALQRAREFFATRNILEVDTPILSNRASVDAHIDLVPAECTGVRCYLHSSPEYCMKRLLASDSGDIYQLSHVFRDGEVGRLHNPEFTLAEWYRIGFSLQEMIEETADFCRLFIGEQSLDVVSYRDAFLRHTELDPFSASEEEMIACLRQKGISTEETDRDALLNLLLGTLVEPNLGVDGLTALAYYPASQAALARTKTMSNVIVAERFELYLQGIELANGYHELADSLEQRNRFKEANQLRKQLGKEPLPIDEPFLQALDRLPDCCGVAVGVDRLQMLGSGSTCLADVLPFPWIARSLSAKAKGAGAALLH